LIKVSVAENALRIEGEPDKLKIFAEWFDFDDELESNYHVHFDHFGHECLVAPDSSSLIISAKKTTKLDADRKHSANIERL
jgi:hypothetical protein